MQRKLLWWSLVVSQIYIGFAQASNSLNEDEENRKFDSPSLYSLSQQEGNEQVCYSVNIDSTYLKAEDGFSTAGSTITLYFKEERYPVNDVQKKNVKKMKYTFSKTDDKSITSADILGDTSFSSFAYPYRSIVMRLFPNLH